MATFAGKVPSSRGVLHAIWVLTGWVVLTSAGCRSGAYDATRLPPDLVAPRTANVDTIDLSELAQYKVSNDRIDLGDELEVTMVTDYAKMVSTTTPVRVADDGTANVPLIGRVAVAGFTLEGAEQAIRSTAVHRDIFVDPHVTVTLSRKRTNLVTVIGAVEEQGVYELPRGSSTLLAALVKAGGLSEEAGPDVEIRRPPSPSGNPDPFGQEPFRLADGHPVDQASYQRPVVPKPQSIRVNLVSAATQGNGGYYLDNGDVVMVHKRPPRLVRVSGLVNQPGEIELPANQDLYLLDALSLAGGLKTEIADKVLILRRMEGQDQPARIYTSYRKAKQNGQANPRLAAGDLVTVEETAPTFAFEMLKSFLRFGISGSVPLF